MNMSAWAIRNPLPPLLLFAILMVIGLWGFMRLPVTYYPRMDVPKVSVTIELPDAAPDQIETEISMPVENVLSSIAGLDEIQTVIQEGRSVTEVEFATSVSVDRALTEVRDAVSGILSDLPSEIETPVIRREEQEDAPIVTYAVEAPELSIEDLTWYVDDTVIRRLQDLPQVRRVERVGGADREIDVAIDPSRLDAFGLTASGVAEQLAAQQIDRAVGTNQASGQDRSLRVDGAATSAEGLGNLPLKGPVRLKDVAEIHDGAEEQRSLALFDGREAVGLLVYPARTASDLDAAAAVQRELDRLDGPAVFHLASEIVTFTEGNYVAALITLAEGALLAIIVVFLFLRDWRATVVVALALPLSIIPTFFVMQQLGFSLNIVSTLAITLVTGILVDDAIVEIENIARHRHMGKSAWRAAVDASDEIGLAVIAISATIIAVFLPVGLMEGIIGQYFRQFGLTVAVAVFFSLLVARLFTPILAARFMKGMPPREREGRLGAAYRVIVTQAVRWRWATMGLAITSFVGGAALIASAPATFLPEMDSGSTTISMELDPGTPLQTTKDAARTATKALKTLPEVVSVMVTAGQSPSGLADPRYATITVRFIDRADRPSVADLRPRVSDILAPITSAQFELLRDSGGREVTAGVRGRDGEATAVAAQDLLAAMRNEPMFVWPGSDMPQPRPVLRLIPDLERAADLGISTGVLGDTLRMSATGVASDMLPKLTDGPRRIPIRARLSSEARGDLRVLERLAVPLPAGGTVPVAAVARIEESQQSSGIVRLQQMRQIEVGADMAPGFAPSDGIAWLAAYNGFPVGIGLANTGDSENQDDTFVSFAAAMGAGILLVIVVLILLFGSVFAPVTVTAALPLSICGVGIALWAGGLPISLPVVIGILMLMGIVTKNSIMLVDVAVEHEAAGMPTAQAAIEAAVLRVRPIVMTTIAMSAGMVPSAIGHGAGGEFRAPLALVVIGGLLASTFLSLIVIPALHSIIADFGTRLARGVSKGLNLNPPENAVG